MQIKQETRIVDLSQKGWQFATLFLLGITWGSSFILMKLGLRSYTPVEVASLRISVSFLFLLPMVAFKLRHVPRNRFKYLALAGIFGNGIPAFLFAMGQTQIDSALAGILNSTAPIFTLLIGASVFGVVFKRTSIIGVLIGLAGTIYLLSTKVDLTTLNNGLVYALLPLLGSFCYGISTNIIKKHLKDIPALVVTGGALTFIGPPCVALLFWNATPAKIFASPENMQNAIYVVTLGIVGTALAVLIFNYLIKQTTMLFAASVTYLIPVFAMGWGVVFGEVISVHYFLGMAVILFGIYLINKK